MSVEDARHLSRLLFEAREVVDMYADVVEAGMKKRDPWLDGLRDRIDAYRSGRGWDPDGFGGESR